MTLDTDEFPLRTIQEIRTAEAPRLYQPHTATRPKTFDWDALTPACSKCGTRTGAVNTRNGLCPTCDPALPAEPTPTRAPRRTAPQRTSDRRPQGPRIAIDVDAVIEAYTGGQTANSIALALRVKPQRIIAALTDAGIELRDDRGRGGRPRTRAVRPRQPSQTINEPAVITEYRAGDTAPTIARRHGCTPKKIRGILDAHQVRRRDDRATASGGKKLEHSPELVTKIRRLYLDERLSQAEVAGRLGTSAKVVYTVMSRHGIVARQGENGRRDGAAPLKAQIADLGVSSHDIKVWALSHGLLFEIAPGIPPKRIVEAYAEAHQDGAA